jgi:ABC-type transport system substrate-binding protein
VNVWYTCDSPPPKYWNYSFYCNPVTDELVEKGNQAITLEERNAFYCDAMKQYLDDGGTLPLLNGLVTVATRSDVGGLYLDPGQTIWPLKYAWIEK